jgi:hypothetical protein
MDALQVAVSVFLMATVIVAISLDKGMEALDCCTDEGNGRNYDF